MPNPVNIPALANSAHPSVHIENGKAITSSVEIARVFDKRHDHVLDAIRTLLSDLPPSALPNFRETTIDVEITGAANASGAIRKSPAYHLTRDGFTLLAMGFNGKRALAFKLAYIDAFNRMEAELAGRSLPPPPVPTKTLTFTVPVSDRTSRWLLHTDRQGREVVTELSPETHVTTIEQLVHCLMISPADLGITLPQMLTITNTCLNNMRTSAGMYANRLNIQPAKPAPVPRGQFSSMGIPPMPSRSPPAP